MSIVNNIFRPRNLLAEAQGHRTQIRPVPNNRGEVRAHVRTSIQKPKKPHTRTYTQSRTVLNPKVDGLIHQRAKIRWTRRVKTKRR